MIDLVYKTLLTIINKEQDGYISPTEFNSLANLVQLQIFEGYFTDENRNKNREHRGLSNKGYSNLDFNKRQKVTQFAENVTIPKTSGKFVLPDDLYLIEDDGVLRAVLDINVQGEQTPELLNVIEEVERSDQNYLRNSIAAPSLAFPTYENYGKYLIVSPPQVSHINVRYLRKPKMPNWTYRKINNQPMFDPSNGSYQDFELHQGEFANIVLQMLSHFGITLREQQVMEIAQVLKQELTIKELQD